MLVTSEDIYDTQSLIDYLDKHRDSLAIKPVRFEKGQTLLSQGQQVEQVLFILEGGIALHRQTVHGRRLTQGQTHCRTAVQTHRFRRLATSQAKTTSLPLCASMCCKI
ncbi:hypothetical protein RJ45_09675 [Photobacterium gaetbulicola]|uniref:Cyclic nucleotide-binding domain-containing protein n=1 Tax=Photobacterium gaetbulicola TaxID=1295392 RepID=A0A0B9G551_9GAMM|nr:cyclic nucleotide-binding domain-containing protein [Photobacterium gaetbulicola]KHT63863.1 hypothetical protein RJ45_09675 [Photobacterium gaetbulicola]